MLKIFSVNANIALVNELALIFEKMGIDTWELIDAASQQALRFDCPSIWDLELVGIVSHFISYGMSDRGPKKFLLFEDLFIFVLNE